MKLLIVIYEYFPQPSPRSFRWKAISDQLVRLGHHVDVITSGNSSLPVYEEIEGVHIYRKTSWLHQIYQKNSGLIRASKQQPKSTNRFFALIKSHIKMQVNYMWRKIYWPDFACLWINAGYRKAKQLLFKNHYDVLITVSYPFSAHIIGYKLKSICPDIRWLVDMGDPFSIPPATSPNNAWLYKTLNMNYEKKVLSSANIVSCTCHAMEKLYRRYFSLSSSKIHVIPPMTTLTSTPSSSALFSFRLHNPDDQTIHLTFLGTLYNKIRNPSYLLQIFNTLVNLSNNSLALHFFGSLNDCQQCFLPYAHLINASLFIHEKVAKKAVKKIIEDSDILVNIGNKSKYQIPSKLAEYISHGKPILNIATNKHDGSFEILRDYPLLLNIIQHDQKPILQEANKINGFIHQLTCNPPTLAPAWSKQFSSTSITAQYENLFKQIAQRE